MLKAPFLIVAIGNASRGDDALGPLVLEQIADRLDPQQVELISDFQLQVEYILDLQDRQAVLFIDAAVNLDQPCQLSRLHPQTDHSYSSHALSPAALLSVYETTLHASPPACDLLAIQGSQFELGAGLSPVAQANLQLAVQAALQWVAKVAA